MHHLNDTILLLGASLFTRSAEREQTQGGQRETRNFSLPCLGAWVFPE
jgi:hypothetical protein